MGNQMTTNKSRLVKVKSADEPWNYIHLVDGTVITTRHIVIGVLQVLDESGNPIVDATGAIQYGVAYNIIVCVESSPMIEERQIDISPGLRPLLKVN